MRLKLFHAPTVGAAMAQVRETFGADALILGTRHLPDGVEITAALEPDEADNPAPVTNPPAAGGTLPAWIRPIGAKPNPAEMDPARLAALRFHGIPEALHPALAQGPLDQALAESLPFLPLPLGPTDPPLLLVGPPGAGKTLTTVRLATRMVMAGAPPMVITADDQRAGATEQLAAFTRLLRINLIVASHPLTLARALTRRGAEPALIDGPGTDPFDPAAAADLRALAGSANATMTLVLPAGLDPAEATDLALAYAEIGARLLIVTRLDLARRVGAVVAAAATVRLPLTEAGIGPDAAGGLTALTPAFLAARIMQTGMPRHDRRAA